MPPNTHLPPTCAPLSQFPSPLPACLHQRSPAGSEPAPRLCRPGTINLRSSMPKPCGFSTPRTRMLRRAYVDTPSRGVTLGAFICGSFFAEAPEINYSEFIKIRATQNSSPQSHHIKRGEMHTKIQEVKYGILFNSKKE
jgi:hypothetical protein